MWCAFGFTDRLTGGDLEDLGRKTDRSLDAQLFVLCAVDQVPAD
jgi:hypothetical protein